VAHYVEQGGAVLIAAGADYASSSSLARTPLGAILPSRPTGRVVEAPFRPQVTDAGHRHPVTANLPGSADQPGGEPKWGRWFRVVESSPESGSVVMTGAENTPLLILDRKGKGRVALLLSDHAWLWARGYEGGGPYLDLLRRLAHWLMKEPDLEEEALHATVKRQEIVIERRTVNDKIGEASVTTPSGQEFKTALNPAGAGRFLKTIEAEEPGLYRISMDGLTALTVAGEMNSPEFRKVVTTDEALAPLLEATGGGAFFLGGTAGAEKKPLPSISMIRSGQRFYGSSWLGLKARDAYEVKAVSYTPLIAGFGALALALVLLSLTWWREGR
jgi:hypothetical protein